jgi:hypothetical protein
MFCGCRSVAPVWQRVQLDARGMWHRNRSGWQVVVFPESPLPTSPPALSNHKRGTYLMHTCTGIISLVVMAVWYVYEKSMMRKLAHTTCVCAAYCFCEEKMNPERIWFGFLVWLQADLKMLEEDLSSHRRMCVLLRLAEKRILLSAIECAAQRIKKWAILPPTTSIYPFKREKKCKSMNYQLLCDPVNSFLCQFHPP